MLASPAARGWFEGATTRLHVMYLYAIHHYKCCSFSSWLKNLRQVVRFHLPVRPSTFSLPFPTLAPLPLDLLFDSHFFGAVQTCQMAGEQLKRLKLQDPAATNASRLQVSDMSDKITPPTPTLISIKSKTLSAISHVNSIALHQTCLGAFMAVPFPLPPFPLPPFPMTWCFVTLLDHVCNPFFQKNAA